MVKKIIKDYEKTAILTVYKLEYPDGDVRYDVDVKRDDGTSASSGLFKDTLEPIIHGMALLDMLKNKDIDAYTRICDDHKEVVDTMVIKKITEVLSVCRDLIDNFYEKK